MTIRLTIIYFIVKMKINSDSSANGCYDWIKLNAVIIKRGYIIRRKLRSFSGE